MYILLVEDKRLMWAVKQAITDHKITKSRLKGQFLISVLVKCLHRVIQCKRVHVLRLIFLQSVWKNFWNFCSADDTWRKEARELKTIFLLGCNLTLLIGEVSTWFLLLVSQGIFIVQNSRHYNAVGHSIFTYMFS